MQGFSITKATPQDDPLVGLCGVDRPRNYAFGMAKSKSRQAPRQWRRNFLREWRQLRGFSIERLAELSGVSPGNISLFENRKQGYSAEGLEKLAKALNCTPGDILDTDPSRDGAIRDIWASASERQREQIVELAEVVTGRRRSDR